MSLWTCPRGHGRRELPITKGGAGVPACPSCQSAMTPLSAGGEFPKPDVEDAPLSCILPGLPQALERLDPELQQEPEA